MSSEFSLVLLGAGLLTAGYFLWPEDDFAKAAEPGEGGDPTGTAHAHASTHTYYHHPVYGRVIILPVRGAYTPAAFSSAPSARPSSPSFAGRATGGMGGVSRGGFGGSGHASVGG